MNGAFDQLSDAQLVALDVLLDQALDADPATLEILLAQWQNTQPELIAPLKQMLRAVDQPSVLDATLWPQRDELDVLDDNSFELDSGTQLGNWRIIELAGKGGMASVYRAERADGSFEKTVAIKLLQLQSKAVFERFLQERNLLARLEHPNICSLVDAGLMEDGRAYLVMDWIEGADLAQYMQIHNPSLPARLQLFLQVAGAVAHAHQHLVVHRDLKPSNVRVDQNGNARLLDFGIAKIVDAQHGTSAATQAIFTPEYAAPEQLSNATISTLTDIHGLGMLLYEMLTGCHPFPAARGSVAAAVQTICNQAPTLPSKISGARAFSAKQLQGDLDAIVMRCLEKLPAQRYPSVTALIDDLQRYLRREPVQARHARWWYQSSRFISRHRIASALAASTLVLLLVAVIGISWQAQQAAQQRDAALIEARRQDALREHLMLMFREGVQTGATTTAKQMLDASASRLDVLYSDSPQLRRSVLLALGELYYTMYDFIAARAMLEKYLDSDSSAGNEDQVLALHSLSLSLAQLGELDLAQQRADQADQILATLPIRKSELAANMFYARSLIARKRGDMDAALDWQRQFAQSLSSAEDATPTEIGIAHSNLAVALLQVNLLDEARIENQRALDVWQSAGQQSSANTITALGNMANIEFFSGNYTQALQRYEEAIAANQVGGMQSAASGALLNNYAKGLLALDRTKDAAVYIGQALSLIEQFTGKDSPDYAGVLLSLADQQINNAQYDQADQKIRQARDIFAKRVGEAHPYVLRCDLSLARVLQLRGKNVQALAEYQRIAKALENTPALLQRFALRAAIWGIQAAYDVDQFDAAKQLLAQAQALQSVLLEGHSDRLELQLWQLLLSSDSNDVRSAQSEVLLKQLASKLGAQHRWVIALRQRFEAAVTP